jgi:hypothetical protein
LVNRDKTDIVNAPFTGRSRGFPCYLTLSDQQGRVPPAPHGQIEAASRDDTDERPRPRADRVGGAHAQTEAGGITALAAAIHDGLGRSFIAAVDLIRAARAGA